MPASAVTRRRCGDGATRAVAGARRGAAPARASLFLGRRAVGGVQRVSRARGRRGCRHDRRRSRDHVVAREQPAQREDRQNGDIASIYDKDAKHELLHGADHARAARQPVAVLAGVGSAVRHRAVAGARVRRESDDQDPRARARARRARDHAQGGGLDVRAAACAWRRAAIAWTSRTSSTGARRTRS